MWVRPLLCLARFAASSEKPEDLLPRQCVWSFSEERGTARKNGAIHSPVTE